MKKIKILLADDHRIFREGIENLISQNANMEVIAQAATGAEALQKAIQQKPDLAILDIAMPVISGIDIIPPLLNELPKLKIIILSMHSEQEYLKKALETGAHGFLQKNCTYQQLIDAIKTVSIGKHYLPENILNDLISNYINPQHNLTEKRIDSLTPREQTIFHMLAEGKSQTEIAEELYISIKTVGTHKSHILEKLNLNSIPDLIKYAIKEGVVTI